MAGHDYLSAEDMREEGMREEGEDWSVCGDGMRHEGSVRGAVEEFFLPKGLTITVTYWLELNWFTWLVQKPMC